MLAAIADAGRLKMVLVVSYLAIAAGLWELGAAQGFWPVVGAGIIVGFFAIGSQLVLYTLAPGFYPTLVRSTGVGSAVSFGRLGGIAGAASALLTFTRKPTEL